MLGSILGQNSDRSFKGDERAIEGLPIRLVIALVVGMAALTLMMGVLDTFSFGADQEVSADFDDSVVNEGDTATITVIDKATGEPIPEADVIVRGDTLDIVDTYDNHTGSNGKMSFEIGSSGEVEPNWRTTQESGKLRFEIIPPADSPYTDDEGNEKLTVIR